MKDLSAVENYELRDSLLLVEGFFCCGELGYPAHCCWWKSFSVAENWGASQPTVSVCFDTKPKDTER